VGHQVVDGEVEQGGARPVGVEVYLNPPRVGDPPLGEAVHRPVVDFSPQQTRVPAAGGVDVGGGDHGEDLVDCHLRTAPLPGVDVLSTR